MRIVWLGFLFAASVATCASGVIVAAQRPQTFNGVITDDMCAGAGHAGMRMGPTDAECTQMCALSHGAQYVLIDGKTVYKLSDQATPEKLAGQRVRVLGTLDAKTQTIRVESMIAAAK
jgi:hypothetical protein